jgi:hypothetical protein
MFLMLNNHGRLHAPQRLPSPPLPYFIQESKMAKVLLSMQTGQCTQGRTKTAVATAPVLLGSRTVPSTRGSIRTIACAPGRAVLARFVNFAPFLTVLCRHGWGTFRYADGNVYTGEFFNGMQHGRGTLVYADGRREDGEFKNDKFVIPALMIGGES